MNFLSKLLIAASLIGLAACDSDDSDPPLLTTTVQVLHASPDAPAVDIVVDGEDMLSDVDYRDSSGWLELDAGSYAVEVQGILPGGNATVIGPADLAFEADTINTIVALNDVQNIEPLVLTRLRTPVSAGAARVTPVSP